jgi:hypothetical protein
MKIADIVTLAKAGYGPKDVLKLLEAVETSPEVKKVEAVVDQETGDVEIKKDDDKPDEAEKEKEAPEDNDIDTLVNLLKNNS